MAFYKIYAGLGGGFGGAVYECTEEHPIVESAEDAAYQYACDIYWSQEGSGINDYSDFLIEAKLEIDENDFEDKDEYRQELEEWVTMAQNEDMESWLDYWVILTNDKDDNDE